MSQNDTLDGAGRTGSSFLGATTSPKSPSRQGVNNRRSTASLRGSSHGDEFVGNGQHSLAHELAVALMPEPSAGSKLLAEEFGIEYDEGAEGIDEDSYSGQHNHPQHSATSFADELQAESGDISFQDHSRSLHSPPSHPQPFNDATDDRNSRSRRHEQDAMETLAQDLRTTDNFLSHLRTIDTDPASHASQQPSLEKLASDVIRHINETTKSREDQVRELLECEREFRKIAGELGGSDVLGQLEELIHDNDLVESKSPVEPVRTADILEPVDEEPSQEWEVDPDQHHLRHHRRQSSYGDDEDYDPNTNKGSFPPPPPMKGPPTPRTTIPQLAHLRSFTVSLVSSLTTISEQCQVNGAATSDAGRKIRALKNKLGDWRTDWDSAEKSRLRIERWEAGFDISSSADESGVLASQTVGSKRADGREVVREHLRAFELALTDAATKTQAIMAT